MCNESIRFTKEYNNLEIHITTNFLSHPKKQIMKNLFSAIIFLVSITVSAQLTFDKTVLDCGNKWVAFPEGSNGFYKYGFIYLDTQMGLTFDYSGNFKIDTAGKIIAIPNEKGSSIKIPLYPNKIQIAAIPENLFEQLKIANKIPDWFNSYTSKEGSIEQLYSWGSTYNAWGECKKALESLEKAYPIDSEFKDIKLQLAHSYNCVQQYEKAIILLSAILNTNPNDAYAYKEYIFALANTQQLDLAIENYNKSLKLCTDTTYVPENAFYILQGYFYKIDQPNFEKWLGANENVMISNPQIKKIIDQMKLAFKKKQ